MNSREAVGRHLVRHRPEPERGDDPADPQLLDAGQGFGDGRRRPAQEALAPRARAAGKSLCGTSMRSPVSAKIRLRIAARDRVIASKNGTPIRSASASLAATKTLRHTHERSRLRATAASS